jgi:hypothetical protein
MWSAVLPVLVGEQTGVFAAFGRSRALTRGSRLKIFVVLFILVVLIYAIMIGLVAAVFGAAILGNPTASLGHWGYLLAMVPIGWLFGMVLMATLVSIYLETVEIKDGHLAEVFE